MPKLLVAAVALVALCGSARADVVADWGQCVSQAGRHLAKISREPADTIIRAAFASCVSQEIGVETQWGQPQMRELRQTIGDRVTLEIIKDRAAATPTVVSR